MPQNFSSGGRLAVVLRQCQWELDDVAFRLPRNHTVTNPVTEQECKNLADAIEEMAHLLRTVDLGGDVIGIDGAPSAAPRTAESDEGN